MKNAADPESLSLVLELQEPQRLDRAVLEKLRERAPSLSRATLKTWFQKDRIHHLGRPVAPSLTLGPGRFEVRILGWNELEPQTQGAPRAAASTTGSFLSIVHEDEDLLILNKTSGTPSVPQSADETETAVGSALAHFPALSEVGRGGFEPGILHRLDTGTSGLLVFAKTQAEFERLHALWKEREVRKIYRAIVRARPNLEIPPALPTPPLTVDWALAHDEKSSKKMVALKPENVVTARRARGKPIPAVTHVLEFREATPHSYDVQVEIETGVMHQIRCHLAGLGWPILGDPIYQGVPSHRLWLHAWKLEFTLKSGERRLFEAPLPDRWPGRDPLL